MSKAFAKKLKSIYTSGDNYTVLTLLEKLLKEFEDFSTGLYRHKVSVSYHVGSHDEGHDFEIINDDPTEFSTDLVVSEVVGSRYTTSGDAGAYIYACNGGVCTRVMLISAVTVTAYPITRVVDTVEEIL